MKNDKSQTVERNIKTTTSLQDRPEEIHAPIGRININDINKRNAEEERQEKKSSYTLAGVIVLLVVVIIVAVYLFS